MQENENNNGGKRGRGRPTNSPNKQPSLNRLKNNRELVKKEISKKAGLFVVQKMNDINELYKDLSPSAKAKLLIELMRFSTTTYAEEMKLKSIEKENKSKDIKEIKISYETPILPQPIQKLEIEDAQEVHDDSIMKNEADDIDGDDDFIAYDDENEPF